MAKRFEALEFLSHLRARWKFMAGTAAAAVILTLIASWLLPERYTSTATLVIEPPAGSDPRAATAVSAVYLESLKSYEEFAASDLLFARAAEKFQLSGGSLESLKRRVLRVSKPKDTRVLTIEVTLRDPARAQAVAEYLARETIQLNRSIAQSADDDLDADLEKQIEEARSDLDKARAEMKDAEAGGTVDGLMSEIRDLAELRFRTSEQLISARALQAEQGDQSSDAASTRARIAALEREKAALDREAANHQAALASSRARISRAEDRVRVARLRLEAISQRRTELVAQSGSRIEQLRLVDPGAVPQEPSFPRPALFSAAAFAIALVLSLAYVTFEFGLSRERRRTVEPELRVARGNR
jgi:uncharacterized protein involved in exopolysaccharide biosynthesis